MAADGIRIDMMVDAVANTVNETLKARWEQVHPDKAAVHREHMRRERSRWLGAEIACLDRARREGWALPDERRYHAFTLVMRLPDGTVGMACHSRERTLTPERELGDLIRAHLLRVLTRFDVGERPAGLTPLPDLCRRALLADGMSPEGAETLGAATGLFAATVGRRRHKAMVGLGYAQDEKWKKAALEGRPSPIRLDLCRWSDIKFTLSRSPGIVIDQASRVLIRTRLPDTVVTALPGRDAATLVDHAALRGLRIAGAKQLKDNVALEMED